MTFHSQKKYKKGSNPVRKRQNKLFSFCFFLVISFCNLKNTVLVRPRNTTQSGGHFYWELSTFLRPKELNLRSAPGEEFSVVTHPCSLPTHLRYKRISSHIILQKNQIIWTVRLHFWIQHLSYSPCRCLPTGFSASDRWNKWNNYFLRAFLKCLHQTY